MATRRRRSIGLPLALLIGVAGCGGEAPPPMTAPPTADVEPWSGVVWSEPEIEGVGEGSARLAAVDAGASGMVAVGAIDRGADRDGLILHSDEGDRWRSVAAGVVEGLDIVDVAARGDTFVAIAQAGEPVGTVLLFSPDGTTWVRVVQPPGTAGTYGHDVGAGEGGFLAAGGDPDVAATWRSADGLVWDAIPGVGASTVDQGINSVSGLGTGWAALGANVVVPSLLRSADGVTWATTRLPADDDQRAYELTIGSTGWIVTGGQGSCGLFSSCPEGPIAWWSADGVEWGLLPPDQPAGAGNGALISTDDAGFLFVDGRTASASADGWAWAPIGEIDGDGIGVTSGVAAGDRLVAVGDVGLPDGSTMVAIAVGDRADGP